MIKKISNDQITQEFNVLQEPWLYFQRELTRIGGFLHILHPDVEAPIMEWKSLNYKKFNEIRTRTYKRDLESFQENLFKLNFIVKNDVHVSLAAHSSTKDGESDSLKAPSCHLVYLPYAGKDRNSRLLCVKQADALCDGLKLPYTFRIEAKKGVYLYWVMPESPSPFVWLETQKSLEAKLGSETAFTLQSHVPVPQLCQWEGEDWPWMHWRKLPDTSEVHKSDEMRRALGLIEGVKKGVLPKR